MTRENALRVFTTVDVVPGDNRTARLSFLPIATGRVPGLSVGWWMALAHRPNFGYCREILSMTNVAALMPWTVTATSVDLALHGYRCGDSSSHVRSGLAGSYVLVGRRGQARCVLDYDCGRACECRRLVLQQ